MAEGGMPEEVRREARHALRNAVLVNGDLLDGMADAVAAVVWPAGLAEGERRATERAKERTLDWFRRRPGWWINDATRREAMAALERGDHLGD